jgi:uncharacterized protein
LVNNEGFEVNDRLPLREQMKKLEQLQELDLKINGLKSSQSALPVGLKVLDDSLAKLKTTWTAKNTTVQEFEKQQRQTQAALDLNRDRVSRSGSRLEGVQNSQEFQAASKEQEQLRKLATQLEEQSKKTAADLEIGNKELSTITAQMETLQAERDAKASELGGQGDRLQREVDSLTAERAKYTPGVDPRILSQYDRVRNARAGLGIVPAVGGRCKGCNMMIPPQQFNELQRGDTLHSCPTCNRILFVPVSQTPATD